MEAVKGLIMTSWTFGGNCLSQYHSGSIYLMDQPWWLAVIGWFSEQILVRLCDLLMWIPLPNCGKIKDEDDVYTWREYYGSIGDLFHIYIHDSIFTWYWKHAHKYEIVVEVGYDQLKQLFGKYAKEYFEEMEERNVD